jgi:tetratricopeptide (TPR) repeat protein
MMEALAVRLESADERAQRLERSLGGARKAIGSPLRPGSRSAVAAGVLKRGAARAARLSPIRCCSRATPRGRDPERWIAEARSLTEIQPRNLGAFLALARALADAGRDAEAIGAYESALALGPVPPVAHAQLARLYWKRGDLEAARAQARLAQQRGVTLSEEFLRALRMPPPGAS